MDCCTLGNSVSSWWGKDQKQVKKSGDIVTSKFINASYMYIYNYIYIYRCL